MSSLSAAGRGRSPCGEHRVPRHTAPMPQRVVRYPWAGVLEGGTTKKPVGHICTPPAELPFLTVPLTAPLRPCAPAPLRPCAPAPLRSAGSFIPQALRFSIEPNVGHTNERCRIGGKLRGGAPQRESAPPAGRGGENSERGEKGENGENGESGEKGENGAKGAREGRRVAPPRAPQCVPVYRSTFTAFFTTGWPSSSSVT